MDVMETIQTFVQSEHEFQSGRISAGVGNSRITEVIIMDFSALSEYFVVVVVVACLIVGYLIKKTFTMIPNKYIPTILAILGAILNFFVSGASIESVVYGALMGLASTGLHQAFTKFVEKTDTSGTVEE